MINCKSEIISFRLVPRNVVTVKSIPSFTIGSIIGKERTGNKACLELAFEIIAEMTVVDDATAIDDMIITKIKSSGDFTIPEFEKIKKRNNEMKLMKRLSSTLNINFPK